MRARARLRTTVTRARLVSCEASAVSRASTRVGAPGAPAARACAPPCVLPREGARGVWLVRPKTETRSKRCMSETPTGALRVPGNRPGRRG